MEITNEQAEKIINSLSNKGFEILSFGNSFENPYEVIDLFYFTEVINEVLTE